VEGERCFFFWAWLVTFPVFSTGFSALIHISLLFSPRVVIGVYVAQSLVFSPGCYCGICCSVFSFLPGLLLGYMLLSL
jgi:hypothetical protein